MAADSMPRTSEIGTRPVPTPPKSRNKDLMRTKLCQSQLQGKCSRGVECPFAHSQSELRSAPDLTKTALCPRFMKGNCTRDGCTYAHGEAELRKPPSFKKRLCRWYQKGICSSGEACGFVHELSEARVEDLPGLLEDLPGQKKVLCEDDDDASTTVPSSLTETMSFTSTSTKGAREECGDFKKGNCTRGDRCRFAHVDFNDDRRAEIMTSLSTSTMTAQELCGDFKKGKCTRGDKCRFSHDDRQAVPAEHIFRMMAGRGSAPLKHQVKSMGLAISELQAKLLEVQSRHPGGIEEPTLQTQVAEMERAIRQLSKQYNDMEAALRASQEDVKVKPAAAPTKKSRPTNQGLARVTSVPSSSDSSASAAMKGALFVLIFALMVMVEVYAHSA